MFILRQLRLNTSTLTLNWNGLDSKDWTFSSVTLYSVIFLTRPIIHSLFLVCSVFKNNVVLNIESSQG